MQTSQAETPAPADKKSKAKRPIIDCDIHQISGLEEIKPYLPRHYRELVEAYGPAYPGGMHFNGGVGGRMADAYPEEGGRAGSDLALMQRQHLDRYNVAYGILTGEGYGIQATINYDYAAATCSAINDYTIEHWLSRDSRLRGSVMIPKQEPRLAAKEIDRVGGRADMVQVIVCNGATLPYGNRYYDPIYEACVRHNLPFTIHVGLEGEGINSPPTGAGYVTNYIETRCARPSTMAAHLASFIFEGVFERFPTLRVVLQEAGVLWLAPLLWKMDQEWKGLRVQTPWVRKRPSEYFREHVRVTTQPIDETPNRAIFDSLLDSIHADETLMYCSDYPHWDYDSPKQALPKLADGLADRVYYDNAAELYGLPPREKEAEG
ncbi:amidohydrolase family protein [Cohnella hashimotonis]|uniref:Amidohydrolase family protein n=1 Tax=Cohnella hashimotonis TaxID=2826895 RepID=A0ABT6TNU3_9BACL|nr:amidohydrolase family protein [Cohnella hashimotonis]MDI4648425.1 amidohydrolase family protein [Cohnella hashimotonis]